MGIDLWVFVALVAPMSLLAWGFLAVQMAGFLATQAGRIRARHGTLRHALALGLVWVLVRVAWGVDLAAIEDQERA